MARLLYGTPTGKHPSIGYVMSVRAMELACRSFGPRETSDFKMVSAPVQMARSQLAVEAVTGRCFQEHDHGQGTCRMESYDYLLMHDDDLALSPQGPDNPIDVWHAMMEAHPDVGAIGAVYMRERPILPNLVVPHPKYPEELLHVVSGIPAEPFDCGGVGTGFMLVRVSALQALFDLEMEQGAPPMFRFPMTLNRWGTVSETGEDYDFCRRLREAGYRVVADPHWRTVHFKERGLVSYDREDWERAMSDATSAPFKELRACCDPALRLENVNGFIVLDHIAQRENVSRAWRERLAARPTWKPRAA